MCTVFLISFTLNALVITNNDILSLLDTGMGVSGFRFGHFAGGNSGYGVSIGVLALFQSLLYNIRFKGWFYPDTWCGEVHGLCPLMAHPGNHDTDAG